MISRKIFTNADGNVTRFLSDFIVRSQDFARPYVYIYDNTLDPGGTEDQLQDGSTDQADWSWPDNIWKRGSDLAQSADIVTVDKWQVVDNSILFFTAPLVNNTIWLEVATTAEEFGDTLTQASVLAAEQAASDAAGSAADSQASADSVAASSAQIETNRLDILTKLPKDGTEPMTGNLEAPSMSIGGVTVDVLAYGITYGSNANGNWIKYPDGTLVQYGEKSDIIVTTLAVGSVYFGTLSGTPFPISFVGDIPIVVGDVGTVSESGLPYSIQIRGEGLSTFSIRLFGTSNTTQAGGNSWIAIGRWK